MKKFAKIMAFAMAGAMLFSTTACSGNSGSGSTVSKIKSSGSITMSTNAEFEPFEYMEGTEFKGIDIEISKKVAEKLGVQLKINNTSFDSLPLELETGKCDFVAAGMTIDPAKKLDFSDPYFDASQAIIVRKDSTIKSAADLAGKKIGVQLGTTGDKYCTDNVKNAQMTRVNKGMDAVADLVKGNLDAVVIDDFPAKKLAEQNAKDVVVLGEALTVEKYGLAVKQGNKELLEVINGVLKDMKSSGELDKIVNSYMKAE